MIPLFEGDAPSGKHCLDCAELKPLEEFPVAGKRRDGRGSYCRECMRERSTASYRRRMARLGRTVRDDSDVPPGHKRCPDCAEIKLVGEFPRNKATADGVAAYCKPCHNARGRASLEKKGGSRDYHLRRRYGISAAEYDALVETQGGLCAVCLERTPEHVDHDHLTGDVRGVLCSGCNQGLGNFRDSAAALRRGADYIERTTWQRHQEAPGGYRLTSPHRRTASVNSSELQRLISSRRG